MNADWFDRLARDLARGMPRRHAVRLMAGAAVFTLFGLRGRAGKGEHSGGPQPDPDCPDGIRSFYRPDCPNPIPKQGYTPGVNGCGPEGGVFGTGVNAVPNSPLGIANFTSACNGHDVGYGICQRPKKDTDDQFLKDMVQICVSTYGGGGVFGSIAAAACFNAAQTYHGAVSNLGGAAYDAGQEAACDCCECKGATGNCLRVRQYRILKERVAVFCNFLRNNPGFQPTQPLALAGPTPGLNYTYTVSEMNALMPTCVTLNALITQSGS